MLSLALLALLAAPAASGAPGAPTASTDTVAITIDDLPFVGGVGPGDSVPAANARILAALEKHRVVATGFVVCERIRPEAAVLKAWQAAGHGLGNHSTTHRAFDRLDRSTWAADVRDCKARMERTLGAAVPYFRYPFLQRGRTAEARDAGLAHLAEMGHRSAPVSIDTGEWILVRPYIAALGRGDTQTAAAIGAAYVRHVVAASRHFRAEARRQFDRAVPHVLLLHANALAADHLDALLTALRADGFGFISLESALADPVYAMADHYAGPIGLSWLYRIDAAQLDGKRTAAERWAWDEGQTRALDLRFGGRDEAPLRIDHDLKLRPVAPATWVVTHAQWSSNALLAEMPDGTLLLADTPATPDATRRLLVWLEARFGTRPIVAINSHHHADALGGNSALEAAGATTWGADLTARRVREKAGGMKSALVSQNPGVFDDLVFAAPTKTFPLADGLTLDFGEPVHVLHPGPGHTADNVVVHLPRRAVLFGGCAVFGMPRPGYVGDADLARWPAAVRGLQRLKAKVVIPGHGPRLDPGLLAHTAAAVEAFVAEQGR